MTRHFIAFFLLLSLVLTQSNVFGADLQKVNEHAAIISSDAATINLEFNLSDLESESVLMQGEDYKAIRITGEGATFKYGKPILPMVSRFVVVPPDVGVALDFTIDNQRREKADLPPKLFLDDNALSGPQEVEIGAKEIYPPVAAEISEPFIIRGARIVKVTTYPIQYDPVNNEYIYNEHIRTSIVHTADEPINPVEVPVRRNRSQVFLKFIRDYAINGDIVGRDDPDRDEKPAYVGHYLIVTHANCLEYTGDFIEWRRKSGYKVDIMVADNPTNAGTTLGQIRTLYNEYLEDGVDPFDYIMVVGDLSRYDNVNINGQWQLTPQAGRSCWGTNINHADYLFACLEGGNNDQHPDVGISRWAAGNPQRLGLASGRTMLYEANPDMDDPDWFERAANYSQHWGNGANTAWHITIHSNARWGEEVLKYRGYEDVRFYERYEWDQQGGVIGPWVRDLYNEGAAVFMGRAENYYWRNNFNGVNENTKFPIRLVASGHGEWCAWSGWLGLPNGSADNLKGPVATTFGWGGPPTAPWSAVWMETVRNVMLQDIPLGWGYAGAIMAVERYFPNENWMGRTNYYECVKTDFNCYGDPGIQPWFGTPRVVEATFPERITAGTRIVEVNVTGENDEPVSGAQVSFYVPGDMPDFDENAYRNYIDMFMMTTTSDEDGNARFVFENDVEFDGGVANITVTGRDICPFFGDIDIVRNISTVELSDYTLTEVEGNENDDVNPGETFNLTITAVNLGNQNALENVTGIVSTTSPWIEIEENEISFGDIPGGEIADGEEPVVLNVHASCPDGVSRPGTRPELNITFSSGDETFQSALIITPSAPNFQVRTIIGGNQVPADQHNLDIDIENVGSMNAPPATARIVTRGIGVSVINGDANYPAIDVNGHARIQGNRFTVSGNSIAVPGSIHPLLLAIRTGGGFVDTAYFELQVEEPRERAPQGPDGYGYICFDDTDQDWDIAPDYDWVEINPDDDDAEFEGVECDFDGNSQFDIGEAEVVEMGMNTQFYGNLYDRITISSNGFISMGSQPRITNLQNWPLDRAMGGGVGMVAPFWDWLDMNNNSKVYYYYDEDNARFIVQWHRMRHHNGGNTDLNFQVILYDNDVWITETGDQNILFQYKTIQNVRGQNDGANREKSNYFASVGISNPNGSSGISYTWNNDYPVTSAELANRRAILFATSPRFRSCVLFGTVTDAETGEPIDDAIVFTEHGFIGLVEEDGTWIINNALAEIPFQITASARGYNDSTLVDLEVVEDDTLEINFSLLHPEFVPSEERLDSELPVDESIELDFSVSNTGNGPLSWSAIGELRGDANAEPWELRRQYPVGQIVEDSRIQGAVYIEDQFYLAGSNNRDPQIYVLNREGELVNQFAQFDRAGGYGYKDLAFDGELIWAGGSGTIHGFTPDGELVHDFEGPFNPNNNFAWDFDREILWVSSTTSNIIGLDREGNIVAELNRQGLRIYGLAYWPDDPDDHQLYVFHKISDVGDQIINKMNPDNGEMMVVRIIEPEGGGTPAGGFITNQFDVYSWVFVAVTNSGANDRLDIWQVDARKDWFDLNPMTGIIEADESQEFVLTLDATGLPPQVLFEADLNFFHNAMEAEWTLPISLDVLGGERILNLDLVEGWNLISINVLPEVVDIVEMLSPLVEAEQLIIAKNGIGQFYLPQQNFNNIDHWDITQGYQLNVTEAAEIQFRGAIVESDQPIPLNNGWNMVSYLPRQPIDAITALSGVADVIEIAKDGIGNFYLPEFGFSNMGDMREGYGYQIKATEETELVYQFGEFVAAEPSVIQPEHFSSPKLTDNNMSVLVIGSVAHKGMELGIYSKSGKLIGSGRFNDAGQCGLAAWGNNTITDEIDGALSGDELSFRLWNGSEESDVVIAIVAGNRQWQTDSYLVGELLDEATTPLSFGIQRAFPNPTNGPVKLVFGVDVDTRVSLKIYDLSGRLAETLVNGDMKAGYHQVTWNTNLTSSGLYLVRLEAQSRNHITKVTVLK